LRRFGSQSAIVAAEPFYQGKTLRVVVASAAGGGSDIVGRLIMRHLSRHIPGNPTIIIENLPGAGEVIGVNYVHNKAKPDGLTALFATGTPITQLLELPASNSIFCKCPLLAAVLSQSPPSSEPIRPERKRRETYLGRREPSLSEAQGMDRLKMFLCWRR